jgi:hypothetical protein
MNGRPLALGVWSLEFDSFFAIMHNGFFQSLAVIASSLPHGQGPVWLGVSSPQQVVQRRALQSITCDVRTPRRPVLHNNIFYYSTPLCHITTSTECAGILMRLDLIYFLAIFILPSIAKTHQSISHKFIFMAFGDKVSAINPRQPLGIPF